METIITTPPRIDDEWQARTDAALEQRKAAALSRELTAAQNEIDALRQITADYRAQRMRGYQAAIDSAPEERENVRKRIALYVFTFFWGAMLGAAAMIWFFSRIML